MSMQEWESRYQAGATHWDKGDPSPGLVDFLAAHPELPPGSVAVPGCGSGHDVRVWAAAGFTVTAIDIAPSAIQLCRDATAAAGLQAAFLRGDFLAESPPTRFDWLFEHTLFCAIDPARRDDYVRAAVDWLRPGGQFLAVHYLIPDQDGPPFGTTHEEVLKRFSVGFELLADWEPRSYPNRVGLERMFWWRRRP